MGDPDALVGPFTEAVTVALRELACVDAVLTGSHTASGAAESGGVSATIRLTGQGEGYLVLCFPERTAEVIAGRVLSGTVDDVSADMVRDCMGEVANVVAGQAKTLFYGTPYHFNLSPPDVVTGPPPVPGGERWVAKFQSDAGEFTLQVRMPVTAIR